MKTAHVLTAGAALAAMLASGSALAQYTIKVGGAYIDPHATSSSLTGGVSAAPLGGHMTLQSGVQMQVQPKSTLIFSIERAFDDHWSAELVLGTPPKHDVKLKVDNVQIDASSVNHGSLPISDAQAQVAAKAGLLKKLNDRDGQTIATVREWAPTFFLNYRFLEASSTFRPFIGLGINITRFKARTTALGDGLYADGAHPEISLSDSIGPAIQVGASYKLTQQWSLNASVATAKVNNKLTVKTQSGLRQEASFRFNPTVVTATVGYSF